MKGDWNKIWRVMMQPKYRKLLCKVKEVPKSYDFWRKCCLSNHLNVPNHDRIVIELRIYHKNVYRLSLKCPEGRKSTMAFCLKAKPSAYTWNDDKQVANFPQVWMYLEDMLDCRQRKSNCPFSFSNTVELYELVAYALSKHIKPS